MSEPRPADAAPPPEKAASQADLQAFAQDRERVQAWLDARATGARAVGASTLSQYRVEAERVCWYARTFGKPIARWLRDDAVAYLRFLQEPPAWAISARGIERDDANWTPLRGALSVRSGGLIGKRRRVVTADVIAAIDAATGVIGLRVGGDELRTFL